LEGPSESRHLGEGGVHHTGRTVEVEGATLGLTSAPATFQSLMEQVLSGLHRKTLLVYLDDVIVISPDFQTHGSRLREVFERLRGAGLKLKPSKCALLQPEVKYLGHIIGRHGVATDPEKVRAVEAWVTPRI